MSYDLQRGVVVFVLTCGSILDYGIYLEMKRKVLKIVTMPGGDEFNVNLDDMVVF